jgi:hypothetical protein
MQHWKKEWKKKHGHVPDVVQILLPTLDWHTKDEALQKQVERLLYHGPDKTKDEAGHIYAYVHAEDTVEMFKIGRTCRTAEERVVEWCQAVLEQSWPVAWNQYAEHLIHLLLSRTRVYRFLLSEHGHSHYLSMWADDETLVDDDTYQEVRRTSPPWCPPDIAAEIVAHEAGKPGRVTRMNSKLKRPTRLPVMETEWFCASGERVGQVVRAVIDRMEMNRIE